MLKRTLFFANPVYLSTKHKQLVVSYVDKMTPDKTVPIEDIGLVLLENKQITITNAALNLLTENEAAVVTCDDKYMPSAVMLPIVGHTQQTERYRKQIQISLPLKKNLWQQVVVAKILNQAAVLQYRNKESLVVEKMAERVVSGDTQNHEGQAAAYYWQNIMPFEYFIRDTNGEPPNNLLNYGYAILRAIVARALVSTGLHPSFGLFHKNKYNPYCLADDVMEPYRPYVDRLVLDIIDTEEDYFELTTKLKMQLMKIATVDVHIDQKKSPLMVGVSRTTNSLYECIDGKSRRLLFPKL